MSAGRHTPGPWLVQHDHGEYEIWTRQPHTGTLARAYDEDINGEFPAEANARLIAQAPAYAAATQPVVDNLVGQDDTPDDDFIPVRAGDLRALNEAHLKAIGQ